MKASQELLTFIFEDFALVGLQFFYFEKFSFLSDNTVYFNAVFMIVKALELTVRGIIVMKKDWKEDDKDSL